MFVTPGAYLRDHPIPDYRLPTPFPFLNDAFGGGLWPGQIYTTQGAPSAGKSSLGVQLAKNARDHGCAVYILASDEGTRAACVRLGQAAGIERDELELAATAAIAQLDAAYPPGSINVVDADAPEAVFETFLDQIEEDIIPNAPPPLLYADSIQNIRTALDGTPEFKGPKERIAYIMELARAFTRRTGAMILFVSHVNRPHFAAKKDEDRIDPLAAAAEAIEITRASDVILDLSGSRHEPHGIRAWLRKNRLHRGAEPIARLRYDFTRGDFSEIDPTELSKLEAEQEDDRTKARREATENRRQKLRENIAERVERLVHRRPFKLSKNGIFKEIAGTRSIVFEIIDNLADPALHLIHLDEDLGTYGPPPKDGTK